jgi:hypothetical protein
MFQLTKTWVDPRGPIDTVEIRYTWSAIGAQPKWGGAEEAEVMTVIPGTSPRTRRAILEIPRYLDGNDDYLLHYKFGGGGEHHEGFSQVFSEEIRAHEVSYTDYLGKVTEVRVLWSVGDWGAPNWTQARLEGLPLRTDASKAGHDAEGEGIADEAIYELVQTVPLPRRFVGKVWGPKGVGIEYRFQLLRNNTPIPGDEFERWDNNNGRNYTVLIG